MTTGDRIWVKAKASSGCPGIRDHFEVNISPTDNPNLVIRVMLEETDPDTLEFRSPAEGIMVASVFDKKEDRNKAKGPLKTKEESGVGTLKKNQAKDALSKYGQSKATDTIPHKAAAGTNSGGGQVVIPVMGGSSRKHVSIPVKTKPARQKPEKPVQWTAYKLESFTGRNGGLPKMNVIKIAFRRSAKLAQLHVKSYPVSLSRNDRTGETLWSVNWNNGEVKDQRLASSPATIRNLSDLAEEKRKGAVAKSALAALIGRQLGPKARHL